MAQVQAWRNFKRMQATACVFASLVYLAAAVHAWQVLPGDPRLKAAVTVGFPAFYALACAILPLRLKPLRKVLKRYVWMSFEAGFGQSALSVIVGLGFLALAAVFIYLQIHNVATGGRYPAGVFSGYGAGIGILIAQALLVLSLERDPEVRARIEGGTNS